MSANNAPFALGSSGLAANAAVYNVNLGRKWTINGADWRLLKAANTLATPQRQVFISALSGTAPTYVANTTVTLDDLRVVAFGKSDQVALALGDFFLGQVSGYGEAISAAAIVAGAALAPSTVAGAVITATAATLSGVCAIALTAAGAGAQTIGTRIIHLS
jgi:hypothetical protein